MADDIKMVFIKAGPAKCQNTNTHLTHVVKKASFYILNCTVSCYCWLIKQVALRIVGSALTDGRSSKCSTAVNAKQSFTNPGKISVLLYWCSFVFLSCPRMRKPLCRTQLSALVFLGQVYKINVLVCLFLSFPLYSCHGLRNLLGTFRRCSIPLS